MPSAMIPKYGREGADTFEDDVPSVPKGPGLRW